MIHFFYKKVNLVIWRLKGLLYEFNRKGRKVFRKGRNSQCFHLLFFSQPRTHNFLNLQLTTFSTFSTYNFLTLQLSHPTSYRALTELSQENNEEKNGSNPDSRGGTTSDLGGGEID